MRITRSNPAPIKSIEPLRPPKVDASEVAGAAVFTVAGVAGFKAAERTLVISVPMLVVKLGAAAAVADELINVGVAVGRLRIDDGKLAPGAEAATVSRLGARSFVTCRGAVSGIRSLHVSSCPSARALR